MCNTSPLLDTYKTTFVVFFTGGYSLFDHWLDVIFHFFTSAEALQSGQDTVKRVRVCVCFPSAGMCDVIQPKTTSQTHPYTAVIIKLYMAWFYCIECLRGGATSKSLPPQWQNWSDIKQPVNIWAGFCVVSHTNDNIIILHLFTWPSVFYYQEWSRVKCVFDFIQLKSVRKDGDILLYVIC